MIRVYEYKIYPSHAQESVLSGWLRVCCRIYNRALEQRIKAYRRRGESMSRFSQEKLLTQQRKRMAGLSDVPYAFERDALRRVELGMAAFFRRLKSSSTTPGFPRFQSSIRWRTLECIDTANYYHGTHIRIPKLGIVRCRGRALPGGPQKILRVIRKPTGWYAQIAIDLLVEQQSVAQGAAVGIDVGISDFATLSTGDVISSPTFGKSVASKTRALHRRISRRAKGSGRRRRAIHAIGRHHERIAAQRRSFCHQHSSALVRTYSLIAVEKLNVAGMVRSRFAKSIHDAAWSTFTTQLVAKAEYAGCQVVFVDPRYTSQECPNCGAIKPKKLSERTHSCACGLVCQRDHAAAQVILARALAGKRGESRVEGVRRDHQQCAVEEAAPVNRVGAINHCRLQPQFQPQRGEG